MTENVGESSYYIRFDEGHAPDILILGKKGINRAKAAAGNVP